MSALEKLVYTYCHTSLDFVASTVAFMERQKKHINVDKHDFFRERLSYYRDIYRPS